MQEFNSVFEDSFVKDSFVKDSVLKTVFRYEPISRRQDRAMAF